MIITIDDIFKEPYPFDAKVQRTHFKERSIDLLIKVFGSNEFSLTDFIDKCPKFNQKSKIVEEDIYWIIFTSIGVSIDLLDDILDNLIIDKVRKLEVIYNIDFQLPVDQWTPLHFGIGNFYTLYKMSQTYNSYNFKYAAIRQFAFDGDSIVVIEQRQHETESTLTKVQKNRILSESMREILDYVKIYFNTVGSK